VTISVRSGEETISVSRTYDGVRTLQEGSLQNVAPLVFGQSEIERLALTPAGRRSLLDGFLPQIAEIARKLESINSRIQSLSTEMSQIRTEIDALPSLEQTLEAHQKQLQEVAAEEARYSKLSAALAPKQANMRAVSDKYTATKVNEQLTEQLLRFYTELGTDSEALIAAIAAKLEDLDEEPDSHLVTDVRRLTKQLERQLSGAVGTIDEIVILIESAVSGLLKNKAEIEKSFLQIKGEIESIQKGAGSISRQAADLRATIAKLQKQRAS
jgi:chromosome segregation ATPase